MMLRFFVPLTRPPPRSTLFPYTRSSDLTPKGVSLMAVNDSLTALMALVDGADSAPSEESFAAFHRVCQGWKDQLAAWQKLKNKDVEAFNELLGKNNLSPVSAMPAVEADTSCGN